MIVLGLTGSIGMGKSTAASMLQNLGVPVHEADSEVHDLLAPGGKAVPAVATAFPYFSYPQIFEKKTKEIKRAALSEIVFNDDAKREMLENILHPYVREAQNKFIRVQQKNGTEVVALDIPLLFETGADEFVDYTIVVSAPDFVQQKRVLERPGMSAEKFHAILERQMPDNEKCERADFVVHTGIGRAETMKELKAVLEEIKVTV